MSTDCGCNPPTDPEVPTPEICNPVTYDEPAATPEPCCLGCYYEDMLTSWLKPSVEDEDTLLAVCDSSRFMVGQCISVLGSNGLGGVYKITALLDGAVSVDPFEPDLYDVGGPGTVSGGRIIPMAACPLTAEAITALVTPA